MHFFFNVYSLYFVLYSCLTAGQLVRIKPVFFSLKTETIRVSNTVAFPVALGVSFSSPLSSDECRKSFFGVSLNPFYLHLSLHLSI